MMEREWFSPRDHLPKDGQAVSWLNSEGYQTDGWYRSRSWWFLNWSMYIGYVPTFWKPRTESPARGDKE